MEKWLSTQDPDQKWQIYFERNAILTFHAPEGSNQTIRNSGLATVWSCITAQDNEKFTQLCRPESGTKDIKTMKPENKAICDLNDWKP